jgi:hypothetical protein
MIQAKVFQPWVPPIIQENRAYIVAIENKRPTNKPMNQQ